MATTDYRTPLKLRPGDIVTVRSANEIRDTLDEDGCLDKLPFMPEMLRYCGKQFRVSNRADKTCDTVNQTGGRRLTDSVHLQNLRCDGSAHGGCQASCLLFWKESWLKAGVQESAGDVENDESFETSLHEACHRNGDPTSMAWRCQATELPRFTELLHWWDIRQYFRDLQTGNTSIGRMISSFAFSAYRSLLGLGIGHRFLLYVYDRFQRLRGGKPYPLVNGTRTRTPRADLDLQPGEYVRVKSLEEINDTLDRHNKNRGLWFDQEMVRYCDGVFRVAGRISQILEEKTGKMLQFGTPCVILENVYCRAEVSQCRLFCPRRIYPYWREVWLKRVEPARD